jgi:hypothetical protein
MIFKTPWTWYYTHANAPDGTRATLRGTDPRVSYNCETWEEAGARALNWQAQLDQRQEVRRAG